MAQEKRLKASIVVPYEDGEGVGRRNPKRAGNRDFAHVLLLSRTSELLGQKRYWPIYRSGGARPVCRSASTSSAIAAGP